MTRIKWLCIGTVGRTHGLAGDCFISDRTTPVPKGIGFLVIGATPERGERREIVQRWFRNGRAGIKLKDIDSPEAIKALAGAMLWAEREHININEAAEYLWADLIGKNVVDASGTLLGVVQEVTNYGASDLMEIVDSTGRHLSIPLVAAYVDFKFRSTGSSISLTVNADVFAEAWDD